MKYSSSFDFVPLSLPSRSVTATFSKVSHHIFTDGLRLFGVANSNGTADNGKGTQTKEILYGMDFLVPSNKLNRPLNQFTAN